MGEGVCGNIEWNWWVVNRLVFGSNSTLNANQLLNIYDKRDEVENIEMGRWGRIPYRKKKRKYLNC